LSWLIVPVATLVLSVLAEELFGWLSWLAEFIVTRASRRLPLSVRERYRNEWLGELDALPGSWLSALVFAVSVRLGVPGTRRELAGRRPFVGMESRATLLKNLIDRGGAALLIVFLGPLFVSFAVAVRLTSVGPVFARDPRITRGGRPFGRYEFRVATSGPASTGSDPRRTKVGEFLSVTGLSSLPVFFNVVRGEMSLVGPAPADPWRASAFGPDSAQYRQRYRAKAGATGLVQVLEWNGPVSLERQIELDAYYVENWSLWLDVKILCRTAWLPVKDLYLEMKHFLCRARPGDCS
jgi:lipopolysaccharide/colanic/teichoic acid biosynthesis glycosyltransferase